MYKLRQTWVKCIPNNKLFALDVRVKRIDPAWPITAKPPEQGSIHVNPKFLVSQVILLAPCTCLNIDDWHTSLSPKVVTFKKIKTRRLHSDAHC